MNTYYAVQCNCIHFPSSPQSFFFPHLNLLPSFQTRKENQNFLVIQTSSQSPVFQQKLTPSSRSGATAVQTSDQYLHFLADCYRPGGGEGNLHWLHPPEGKDAGCLREERLPCTPLPGTNKDAHNCDCPLQPPLTTRETSLKLELMRGVPRNRNGKITSSITSLAY